jgi:hypothetical protein
MKFCDFCDITGHPEMMVSSVNSDPYFGWIHCSRRACRDASDAAYEACTYPKEKLEQEFSIDQFRVLRSNGQMDERGSWKFSGQAVLKTIDKELNDTDMWVPIETTSGPKIRKNVPLSELRMWQKPRMELLMGLSSNVGVDSSIYRAFVVHPLSETRLISCINGF